MSTRELGRVERVEFGVEDHGILTLWLHLRFSASGQAFGGVALDEYDRANKRRVGTAAGMTFVLRVLELFGAKSLDAVAGRYVYALRDTPNGTITGLQLPEVDGGARFDIADWRREWYPEHTAEAS